MTFAHRLIGIIGGIVLTICALAAFNLVAKSTLSHDRLVRVVKKAYTDGELALAARPNEDFFTECALLTMLYLRQDGFRDVVDTQFAFSESIDPCEVLRVVVNQEPRDNSIKGPYSYLNYPWGSRHLEALVLSALEYSAAKTLYRILSYGAIVFLFLGAWRNSWRTALLMAPVGGFLFFGFELTTFGANPGHAPGYFIGFFALGIFLAAREWFKKASRRFVFFGALGTLIADFDLMTGSLQAILSLAVVFNHFFYLSDDRDSRGYWARATKQAFGIVGCFALAYVTLTAVRMGVASLYHTGGYYDVAHLFSYTKPGYGVPRTGVTLRDLVIELWLARFRLTGDALSATWLLYTAAAAWIFGFIGIAGAFLKRRMMSRGLATDFFIILLAGGGIIAWYLIFQGHTLTHVSFMVRLIALPAAYGFLVAILTAQSFWAKWNGKAILVTSVTVVISSLLAGNLLHNVWDAGTLPQIMSARFSQENSDRVSCAVLGRQPDGVQDGLIEFVLRPNRLQPPLTLLGLRKHEPRLHIYLQRFNPGAIYETGSNVFLLGITATPDGELLNRADGRFVPQDSSGHFRERLWAHFCRWQGEAPESLYEIRTDLQRFPVSRP
jgi:hypothetical protein